MSVSVFGQDTGASDHKRMQTKDFLKMQRMKNSVFKWENVAFGHDNIIFVLSKNNKGVVQ